MKDQIKDKILLSIIVAAFSIVITIVLVLFYYRTFPLYNDFSPHNYFPNNVQSIDLNQYKTYVMQDTKSMLPTIPINSTVIVVPLSMSGNLFVGDIVAFNLNGYSLPIAHRIIQIKKVNGIKLYLTKGDNVKYADMDWINNSNIIGRVIGVLY